MLGIINFTFIFVLLILISRAIAAEELLDGNVYHLEFTSSVTSVVYKFNWIDPLATTTIMISSEDAENEAINSGVFFDETCTRQIVKVSGFSTYEIPFIEESMLNSTLYVKIWTTSEISVDFTLMSSYILEHTSTITINNNDGYDYDANGRYRYFRAFLCNQDRSLLTISMSDNIPVEIYVGKWDSSKITSKGKAVGRPDENAYDGSKTLRSTTGYIMLTEYALETAPSWIFFGIYLPSESGTTTDINITTSLDIAVGFTESDPISDQVCIYENCLTTVFFELSSRTEIEEYKTLQILIMPIALVDHSTTSVYNMVASTSNPPVQKYDNFYTTSSGNLLTIDSSYYDFINEKSGKIYIGISTTQSYRFPQYEDLETNADIMVTYLFDTTVIKPNSETVKLTLAPITDSEGNSTYAAARTIIDASEITRPTILNNSDDDSISSSSIECDYYIKIAPNDSTTSTSINFKAGLYIGQGTATIPNTEEFLIDAKTMSVSETSSIKSGTMEISLKSTSNSYFKDGAYIMDVYNDVTSDSGSSPSTVYADVTAIASWYLEPSIQYEISFIDDSLPEYFTLNSCNVSRGVSIYAEASYSQSTSAMIYLYASLENQFPDSSSPKATYSNANVSLLLESSYFENASPDAGCYDIYLSLYTTYNGKINLMFTEGAEIEYNISDGQETNVQLTSTDTNAFIKFHSDEVDGAEYILLRVVSETTPWPTNTKVNGCISTEFVTNWENRSGTSFTISANKLDTIVKLDVSGDDNESDYFISLFGVFPSTNIQANDLTDTTTIALSVFAEHYTIISDGEPSLNIASYADEPFLLYLSTSTGYDYSVITSFPNSSSTGSISYRARICYDRPAYSTSDPAEVDSSTNIRNCSDYIVNDLTTTIHDLRGDVDENEKTSTNDLNFIKSTNKYISYFPINSLSGTRIKTEVYQDVHVSVNKFNTRLTGQYREFKYFRLKVPGSVSVNSNDKLVYQFESNYAFAYCLSKVLHTKTGSSDCIKGEQNITPTTDNKIFSYSIALLDIYPNYEANDDLYIYFSYIFSEAPEDISTTMYLLFSNSISHYLNTVDDDDDNINTEAHIFDMLYTEIRSFTTSGFDPARNIRFMMSPYVTTADLDNISSIYYTNPIAVNIYEKDDSVNIRPTTALSYFNSAGIVLFEYEFDNKDTDYWANNSIRFVTALTKFTALDAYYKTTFLGSASDSFTNVYSDITIMSENTYYRYKYDPRSTNSEDKKTKSVLYYYPSITSDNSLKIFPCAGAPGVYNSYISTNPQWNDGVSMARPTGMRGYKYGKSYSITFLAFTDDEYPEITVPTGMMFNFTVDYTADVADPDPENNVRWDAEALLINSTTSSSTGGPTMTNKTLTVVDQYGLQVNIQFAEALSGYKADPNVTKTHIEYAVFAIPAVSDDNYAQYFDASPNTHCGLIYYGFPITADRDSGEVIWTKGTIDSNADGSSTSTLNSTMVLKTSYDPNKHEYPSSIRPNLNSAESHMFNVNVVAREINDETNNVIGYSVYDSIKIKISGSFPVTVDGLFAWEIALIVISILIVIAAIIIFIVFYVRKKKRMLNYGNLDGQGNNTKTGVEVDIPNDDLAVSSSSRNNYYEV